MAFSSEMRAHSSPAVSRMVAGSRVPKAARTSDMVLRIRLTLRSKSSCAFHNDSYAWKLAPTSCSRLSDVVWMALRSTIQPVSAKSSVMATEVESKIFQSSDKRENDEIMVWHRRPGRHRSPADNLYRTCPCAEPEYSRFRKWWWGVGSAAMLELQCHGGPAR